MAAQLRVRFAEPSDATALVELAADLLGLDADARELERGEIIERLELGAGEDHFVLVAVDLSTGAPGNRPRGLLVAGASRDADAKGAAEIYELLLARGGDAPLFGAALVEHALELLEGAAYARVVAWVGTRGRIDGRAVDAAGFHPDGARRVDSVRQSLECAPGRTKGERLG